MLIVGAISGIQDYVFEVAFEGGRQARRLRARSFFVQVLSECAVLRIRAAAGWGPEVVVTCAAGRFTLAGPSLSEDQRRRVLEERTGIERWLLDATGLQLRFSLAIEEGGGSPEVAYARTMEALRAEAAHPGVHVATREGKWLPEALVLPPLSPPCEVCRHRPAVESEPIEDTDQTRSVCRRCADDLRLGQEVTRRAVMVIRAEASAGDHDVLGLGVSFTDAPPADTQEIRAVSLLQTDGANDEHSGIPPGKRIPRPLLAHVPRDLAGRPLEFLDLADRAMGDALLGVLKMDVDSLGETITGVLRGSADFGGLTRLSGDLDQFFARVLADELRRPPWDSIYTVFAGGDDLLVVGPWDIVLDYAIHVQRLFRRYFSQLSISAGFALIKPKFSIRHAVAQAEDLLDDAKTSAGARASAPKAQCAALGEIFKWPDVADIVEAGKRWAEWVESSVAARGWLHQLLELAEARDKAGRAKHAELLAPARLAYQVQRNYPAAGSPDPRKRALRQWIDARLEDLDAPRTLETIGLGAIVRYALIATRSPREED
jgi:CRISPR-associated protein Csm1